MSILKQYWKNFFFSTIDCTQPTTSFFILLVLKYILLYYISLTFVFTTDPSSFFFLVPFLSFILFIFVVSVKLMFELGVGGGINSFSSD